MKSCKNHADCTIQFGVLVLVVICYNPEIVINLPNRFWLFHSFPIPAPLTPFHSEIGNGDCSETKQSDLSAQNKVRIKKKEQQKNYRREPFEVIGYNALLCVILGWMYDIRTLGLSDFVCTCMCVFTCVYLAILLVTLIGHFSFFFCGIVWC